VGLRSNNPNAKFWGMAAPVQTVADYLDALPAPKRAALLPVLELVRSNLPAGYEEVMSWGMPTWQVPLATYPNTHNKQPLLFAGLAARKGHLSLYLSGPLADPVIEEELAAETAKAGKSLDMGVSCIRFKSIEELHLPAIAMAIKSMPLDRLVAQTRAARKK
jgi:hypothetical protein